MASRLLAGFGWLLFGTHLAIAQTYDLSEPAAAGDCLSCELETRVTGSLLIPRDGKQYPVTMKAATKHALTQRVMQAEAGKVTQAAHLYSGASLSAWFGGGTTSRELPADRRLIVARQTPEGVLHYHPKAPLTRYELELVADHFGLLDVNRLLPGKAVAAGEEWAAESGAVQGVCGFDALVGQTLKGKLAGVEGDTAKLTFAGEAEGVEAGASVKQKIDATASFDLKARRLTELTWVAKDVRQPGPAGPGLDAESVTMLKRAALPAPPEGLKDADLTAVPAGEPAELLRRLTYEDPKGRYRFICRRDWHPVSQTEDYLVLRLIERGDFLAQASVTPWEKAEPGKHIDPEALRKAVAEEPGWRLTEVLQEGEVPTDAGWVYRVVGKGRLHGAEVIRNFYAVAGPRGDQVLLTFTMRPEKAEAVGTADAEIAQSVSFPGG